MNRQQSFVLDIGISLNTTEQLDVKDMRTICVTISETNTLFSSVNTTIALSFSPDGQHWFLSGKTMQTQGNQYIAPESVEGVAFVRALVSSTNASQGDALLVSMYAENPDIAGESEVLPLVGL